RSAGRRSGGAGSPSRPGMFYSRAWRPLCPRTSRSRFRGSSRRSGPSSTGSVVPFGPAALKARLDELEQELAQPDFWSDQQRAARLSAEHQRTQQKLQRYDELVSNVEFLREGAGTFPDEELEPVLRDVRGELGRLQEEALFSGEYDGGDAVVTIQADAGGTDAQDWAEILLRMYLRWAEQRGRRT